MHTTLLLAAMDVEAGLPLIDLTGVNPAFALHGPDRGNYLGCAREAGSLDDFPVPVVVMSCDFVEASFCKIS